MGIPSEVGNMSCSWAQRPRQGHRGVAMGVGQSTFETEKQSLGARPSHNLPELISLCPCCQVVEYITLKPEKWYYRVTFFFWSKEGTLWSWGQGTARVPNRSKVTITTRTKQQRRWLVFLQPTEPPHLVASLIAACGCRGKHWDFMDLEPNGPPHFPVGLAPWDLGAQITGVETTHPGNNAPHIPENPEKFKRAKQLWFSVIYWKTIEWLCVDLLKKCQAHIHA